MSQIPLLRRSWLLLVLVLGTAAGLSARDLQKEAAIENELAALNASLVPDFRAAREAMDRHDYATAAKLLRPICERAPTFDAAHRRLGSSLALSGQRLLALPATETALKLKHSAANLQAHAFAMAVADPQHATDLDRHRAIGLVEESLKLPDGADSYGYFLYAQLALSLGRKPEARIAISWLEKNAPDQMHTHYFSALLAADEEHWVKAEDELQRAAKLGLAPEEVQRLLDAGIGSRATAWRIVGWTVWTVTGWAAGLAALFLLGFFLSWQTLRQIERADPTVAVNAGERSLRKLYRAVVNVAGVYYYISLPIVLILVVGVVAAALYLCLMAGTIPIKLMLLLGIAALVTIWAMLRSLFLRVQTTEPGRPLSRDDAAGLWKLAEDVAADLNTKPVDEIRLTPGTDLCVYELGTWREKMRHQAKRVLVVGTAVLPNFLQEHFRSVLAHEYGHFAHRDTAGGDVAFRVERDMMQFYFAMRDAGQASYTNVAFHFLRLYNFLFRRISHGATRLQEVLADRVAAQAYGAAAFEGGLRHVIRQDLAFDAHAGREINDAIRAKRPIQNLYAGTTPSEDSFEKKYETAIGRPTTPDDTHPGPLDRFRLVARVKTGSHIPLPGLVWDLFRDRAAVEAEMTAQVEKNIAGHRS